MAALAKGMRVARQCGERAFTLVELLVVIAVIMILASLVMPAMARAQRSALVSSCMCNLRQIAQGLFIYAKNNSMMMPCMTTGSVAHDDLSALYPGTLADINVFRCPASSYDFPKTAEDLQKKTSAGGELSYEYCGEYVMSLSRRINSEFALLGYDDDGRGKNVCTDVDAHSPEGGNMSFVDGRVEFVKAAVWWYAVYDGIYAWANPPRKAPRPQP